MSKKYYAVIDTNVLVAAHLSRHDDSAVVRVYKKIIGSEIIPLYVDSQSEKLSPQ